MLPPLLTTRTGRSILIVSRRDEHRARLESALAAKGFVPSATASAAECIRLVRRAPPSAIVMDRTLDDGDGWELIPILKALSSSRRIPVVALTSDASRAQVSRALTLGCDAFLAKPCEPAALLAQLQQYLDPTTSDA